MTENSSQLNGAASAGINIPAYIAKVKEFAAANNHGEAARLADRGLSNAIEATEAEVMTLLFLKGTALGNLDHHEEARECGNELVRRFPESSRGYYILAVAAGAQGSFADAIKLFRMSKERLPKESQAAADAIDQKIQEAMLMMKRRKFVSALAEHSSIYQSYTPLKCPDCKSEFEIPTPQWYCSKCFPAKGNLIWEPDVDGQCGCCEKSLGKGSRHHCRCCGRLCCSDCSKNTMPVPALGFHENVRVCYKCHKVTAQRHTQAAEQSRDSHE